MSPSFEFSEPYFRVLISMATQSPPSPLHPSSTPHSSPNSDSTPTPSPSPDTAHDQSDPVEDKDEDFIPDAETWYDSSSESEGLQGTPFKVSEALSITFYSKANESRYATLSHRTILPSYVLNVSDMSKYNLVHFFKESHLLPTHTYTTPYCQNLIF